MDVQLPAYTLEPRKRIQNRHTIIVYAHPRNSKTAAVYLSSEELVLDSPIRCYKILLEFASRNISNYVLAVVPPNSKNH